ncbi:MAG: MFS transporter [Chloroflexi bacterium]|nr:MFS transporter [Chloroflexota bacterium]
MFLKRIQLGLLHVALTITLLPITSTLNRVMINELAFSATLVALLASLPYLFSPIQLAIGTFSDRNPILGWRRTPYIFIGLLLCFAGVVFSPRLAYLLQENFALSIVPAILAFGAWGMGYNFAAVSYFSLATELSGKNGRGKTIAVMFFMMVVSIIFTSEALSHMLEPFGPEALNSAFLSVGIVALILGFLGLIKLEPRHEALKHQEARYSWRQMYTALRENKQVLLFFRYLILMLVAILGQDVLLEPYVAEAFKLSVSASTRLNSVTGTFFLISLTLGGVLENRISKMTQARIGGWCGVAAFLLIVVSGVLGSLSMFYVGISLLGFATGLATVSNLSLMLDMTTVDKVGMFVGVWGMANAASRLVGNLVGGALRDGITQLSGSAVFGYQSVFAIEMLMLLGSLWLLRSIDVQSFKAQVEENFSYTERAALAGDS